MRGKFFIPPNKKIMVRTPPSCKEVIEKEEQGTSLPAQMNGGEGVGGLLAVSMVVLTTSKELLNHHDTEEIALCEDGVDASSSI